MEQCLHNYLSPTGCQTRPTCWPVEANIWQLTPLLLLCLPVSRNCEHLRERERGVFKRERERERDVFKRERESERDVFN